MQEGVEEDGISLLFGSIIKGDIDHEYESYLSELTSYRYFRLILITTNLYSLERLSKEPDSLKEHAQHIKQQMQELSYLHYKSFIQTSNSIRSISTEVIICDINNTIIIDN